MFVQYTALGFEPSEHESRQITARPGLPPKQQILSPNPIFEPEPSSSSLILLSLLAAQTFEQKKVENPPN